MTLDWSGDGDGDEVVEVCGEARRDEGRAPNRREVRAYMRLVSSSAGEF